MEEVTKPGSFRNAFTSLILPLHLHLLDANLINTLVTALGYGPSLSTGTCIII